MGNVKTIQIKKISNELIKRFPKKFSSSFDDNKHQVAELTRGTTKKVRNTIAGYITGIFTIAEKESASQVSEEEIQI